MYKKLRELLKNAVGRSQFIIAIVIDIRGFTPFCQEVDSANVALFIKKVYAKIIDSYFPKLEFYKPTGDGLLLVIPYEEKNLKELCNQVVETCIKLAGDFKSFVKSPMINFDVPKYVGIGISRGNACCLMSENVILDYSGKRLNLASRLMDIARPSGVVIDHDFGMELLRKEIATQFESQEVYVRGIAEDSPIKIHYMPIHTIISDMNKQPIQGVRWKTDVNVWKSDDIDLDADIIISLKEEPFNVDELTVIVETPYVKEGKISKGFKRIVDIPKDSFKTYRTGSTHKVRILTDYLVPKLEEVGVGKGMDVKIKVVYPTR